MMETAKMIEELTKAFHKANEELWDNSLPTPMIIVSRKAKKHELGFITVSKVWHKTDLALEEGEDVEAEARYEINISAECLQRPAEEIIGILIHEMVHLYNLVNEIKDTSMGQVHNKAFKREAERVGLEVSKGKGVGFGITMPGADLCDKIASWEIDGSVFSYVRMEEPEKEAPAKKSKYKYTNPEDAKMKFTCKYDLMVSSKDSGVCWESEFIPGDDDEEDVTASE